MLIPCTFGILYCRIRDFWRVPGVPGPFLYFCTIASWDYFIFFIFCSYYRPASSIASLFFISIVFVFLHYEMQSKRRRNFTTFTRNCAFRDETPLQHGRNERESIKIREGHIHQKLGNETYYKIECSYMVIVGNRSEIFDFPF